MQENPLIGKKVKVVFTDKDTQKVVFGSLLEEDEFSVKVKDEYGDTLIIGKRTLVFLKEVST